MPEARRIFVTGARGYLGGRLVQDLAADSSFRVVGTTRKQTAPPQGWPSAADLIAWDPLALDEAAMAAALRGVDTIVHLAAPNEVECGADLVASLESGCVASLKLLRAACAAGCRRFIFLSTIHVYGSPLPERISETDAANPVHPYAIIHRTAEDFVRAAHAKGDIEGVVLRLSNGIGAPAWLEVGRWTLVGNDLCRQAIQSGRIILRSSGLQWRDFILLRDFVRAIRLMIDAPASALGEGLFNLGGRLPLRMLDIAEVVARRAEIMLERSIPISRQPAAAGVQWPSIDFSIDRIATLGFVPSPRSALDAEIDRTLDLCRRDPGSARC
ncbi:MAG: SDR family oxidoreductase [Rhizomicrobium sp.]|jgi:UDP-glucose 4-epimerase